MGQRWKNLPCWFGLAVLLTIGEPLNVGNNRTLAQITPDTTLGTERSVVTPNVNIRGLPADRIDGGATRGTNLFHSFSDFNVGEGLRVYFSNPTGIENILTRVTGNNLSNILGTLGVDGGANLFLLNPNGIIFGPNAKLDIAGSFVASTANGVVFDNGFNFSTTNPQAPPLLTISVPLGLQYGSNPSGATITNSGNLTVGQNLGLVADNLDLKGQLQAGGHLALLALNTLQVRDSTTKPFMAKAGGQMVVQGNQLVDIFALNHSESGFFSGGDMIFRSANTVVGDARYSTGGSFQIEGLDGTLKDLSSPNDPIIRSRGDVRFNNYIGTSLHIVAGGSVTIPGLVAITAPETGTVGVDYLAEDVKLSDGRIVSIDGRARPTLDVRAGVDQAEFGITGVNRPDFFFYDFWDFIWGIRERPFISANATRADIKIGAIAISGSRAANGQVFLTNQYRPKNLPGNIEVGVISTTDDLSQLANQLPDSLYYPLYYSGLLNSFSGNAGSVILDSKGKITIDGTALANFGLNLGLINTSSGTGNAGDITLLASDRISLANTLLLSDTSGAGRGGDIMIKAPSVSFTNGTVVSTSTLGTGQGGKLTVIAPNSVDVARSKLFAATTGDGNAGDLNIVTGRLTVRDEAAVATVSLSDGDAGDLRIDTKQLIVQDGLITTSTLSGPSFGRPLGKGDGGELIINASDSVELVSTSADSRISLTIPIPGFAFPEIQTPIGLFSSSQSSGNAGNLTITTGRLTVQGGAMASTTTSFGGRGGNLTVNASKRVELIGTSSDTKVPSALVSDTYGSGKGGDITIITPHLLIKNGGAVSAATGRVFGGNDPDSTGQGGNLTVLSSLIELNGASSNPLLRSGLLTSTVGFGNAGDMQINTDRLIIGDGAVVLTAALRDGNSGKLTINASESVEVVGTAPDKLPSGISSGTAGSGAGRDLTINTRRLTVRNGGLITAGTAAVGAGGNLTVNASELVELIGTTPDGRPSGLSAGSGINGVSSIPLLQQFGVDPSKATGDSGNLNIMTGRLVVRDKAEVSTATLGSGFGGNIQIRANSLALSNAAQVSAATSGSGRAGNISVYKADSIDLSNSSITSAVNAGAVGQGGTVDIQARSLSLNNGARVSAATSGKGSAGSITVRDADTISLSNSSISSAVNSGATVSDAVSDRSGNINLQARQLFLTNGSEVAASTSGQGNAGSISVRDAQEISLSNSSISSAVNAGAVGQGGTVDIQARSLSLNNGARMSAATSGKGSAGSITVRDADTISLSNSSISSAVNSGATVSDALSDRSGNINLQARRLFLTNGSEVAASTSGQGNAGSISVRDAQEISLSNSSISSAVNAGAVGQGGTVDIQARSLSLNNGARVSAATSGKGSAGSITVRDADSISLSNSSISSAVNAGATVSDALSDRSGNINLQARQLFLTNGSEVAASTSGQGNAGSISVRDAQEISLTNSSITSAVNAGAVGEGGTVDIQARSLSLNNGARLSAATSGKGSAGSITVRDADSISLSNSSISSAVNSGATVSDALSDRSGNINLQARQLFLTNGSEVAASTSGQGNAGSIAVRDADLVSLSNSSISSAVNAGAVGQGGKIDIRARSLSLNNGARVSAATSGQGNAGSIAVRDAQEVSLDNSSISSAVNAGAVGQGGKIDIRARSLSLNNNAQVSAGTSGTGKAGNISVYDADSVFLNNSSISTAVNPDAVGQGGDVDIQTRSLSLNNAAQISASTSGQGRAGNLNVRAHTIEAANGGQFLTSTASSENAGNITLTVKDDVKLIGSGSGVFANTTPGSRGNGGSIALNMTALEVLDGAGIAVGSQGTGAGGDVEIQSNSLTLNNRGFISAKTASNTGGNITLSVQDLLLLRHGSEISTTAGTAQAGGDGGNITISAGFILGIPQENSDITANAFKGRGGNINITTQGIFGLEFRPRLTPLSDITASSEFGINGTVQINTLGIDPNRGLAELPTDLVDAAGLIDRRCQPGEDSTQNSSFTITGRGGLPPNPNETLGEEGLLEDLGTPAHVSDRRRGGQSVSSSASSTVPSGRLVEAQGWIVAPDGRVILTAEAPSATPQHPWQTPASCKTLSNASPR
jgi:filamentous hemagglutinin family protein